MRKYKEARVWRRGETGVEKAAPGQVLRCERYSMYQVRQSVWRHRVAGAELGRAAAAYITDARRDKTSFNLFKRPLLPELTDAR